jgi:molybdopterin/thiamine biosynthesis adenylyltransferase/rhodanese-related sulfurtransferase
MPPTTYTDLLASVRNQTKAVALDDLKKRIDAGEKLTLLDVREKEEFRAGYIPGAISIPRGFLEMQVEARLPDKEAKIVAYCAGGTRSALAAATLASLGYTNVETATPGFTRWKDVGYPVELPPQLTEAQRDRYSRHILLPEVGELGQTKLLKSKVLLLGAGGLGSPAALYLAAAGVGTLGLVDADVVDASNLQRQIIHATSRIGDPKVESAAKTIAELNPDVKVIGHRERLTSANVERLFADYEIIVDGTDNFPTRYLVNDASVWMGKPVVHGSIFRFDGQATTFLPAKAAAKFGRDAGPCYPEPPPAHLAPSCQEAGVLGILCGIIGTIQATEAIKLILGKGDTLAGRLMTYDSLKMKFRELKLRRDKDCPVCGDKPTITSYIDYEGFCAI